MKKIPQLALDPIDLELAGIKYGLYVLEDHLESIEADIARLSMQAKSDLERKLEGLKKQNLTQDEWGAESSLPYQLYHDHVDIQLPLLYRGSFIVMLYSAYESAITEIADFTQSKRKLPLSLTDIKGDLSERIKKYFYYCLGVDVAKTNKWESLKTLTKVRNVYAHTGGRTDVLSSKKRENLRKIIDKREDIERDYGYLIVKMEFTQAMIKAVSTFINWLIDQVKQQAPTWAD